MAAKWAKFPVAVRSAKPGEALYAPLPYPRTRGEILKDFEYTFRQILLAGGANRDVSQMTRRIASTLEAETLRIEILRVENWNPDRCSLQRPKPFYFVLRLFAQEDGAELGRFVLHDSGLWAEFTPLDPVPGFSGNRAGKPLELAGLRRWLETELGQSFEPEEAQYVAVDALPGCSVQVPCVAFKAEAKIFLLTSAELLYEVDFAASAVPVLEMRRRQIAKGLADLGPDPRAPMVTLGFVWAPARLIAGEPPGG